MTSKTALDEATEPLFITRITVNELFGRYSYDLRCDESTLDCSQLLLLYGENGTGKTTILSIVYHLVSKEPGKGHRTALAKSRFKRLSVQLSDGTELSATRSRDNLVGTFRMVFKRRRKTYTFAYNADKEGEITLSPEQRVKHLLFNELLPDLNLFFLPDDRKMSTEVELQGHDSEMRQFEVRRIRRILSSQGEPAAAIAARTEPILEKLVQWIREQALAGSNVGQLNVNSIYSEIVGRLLTPA